MTLLRRAPRQCLLGSSSSSNAARSLQASFVPFQSSSVAASSQSSKTPSSRSFSSTPQQNVSTRMRKEMWQWLSGPGANLKEPRTDGTNYLGAYDRTGRLIRAKAVPKDDENKPEESEAKQTDPEKEEEPILSQGDAKDNSLPPETQEDLRPFPQNQYFHSQAVLSEDLKEEIWRRVQTQNKGVREVSQALSIDMARVAAVVRMKEIEKRWIKENKPLARPYARAISGMLPQTPFNARLRDDRQRPAHEPINMLPVHDSTKKQIFLPTDESRHFTRADAGRAFARTLLPADARIPHPDMVTAAHEDAARRDAPRVSDKYLSQWRRALDRKLASQAAAAAAEAARVDNTAVVSSPRWDFRIEAYDATATVPIVRAPRKSAASWRQARMLEAQHRAAEKRPGVGWRYGVPLDDRKKGRVKIPTSVEV